MASGLVQTAKPMKREVADLSLEHARAFTYSLVAKYWRAISDGVTLRPPDAFEPSLGALTRSNRDSHGDVAERLAGRSPLEASFHIGRVYTSLLPRAHRSRHGVFFTPPALARRLLELARLTGVDVGRAKMLDPACGGGAFLAPMASAIMGALKGMPADAIIDHQNRPGSPRLWVWGGMGGRRMPLPRARSVIC